MAVMEPLTSSNFIEVLGEAPCPLDCGRQGQHVRLFSALEVTMPCAPCQERAEAKREEDESREITERMLRVAGATPLYLDWTLESYPDDAEGQRAVEFARGWLDRYREGVTENAVIFGPQGVGKTGLAWSVIRELVERDRVVCKLVTWREALNLMRDAFRRSQPVDELTGLRRIPVLVVDDVGSERPTDFARAELLDLVDYRHLNKLPTWYTSNYGPDELIVRLGHDEPIIGARIVSRMVAGAVQFRLGEIDRRVA